MQMSKGSMAKIHDSSVVAVIRRKIKSQFVRDAKLKDQHFFTEQDFLKCLFEFNLGKNLLLKKIVLE